MSAQVSEEPVVYRKKSIQERRPNKIKNPSLTIAIERDLSITPAPYSAPPVSKTKKFFSFEKSPSKIRERFSIYMKDKSPTFLEKRNSVADFSLFREKSVKNGHSPDLSPKKSTQNSQYPDFSPTKSIKISYSSDFSQNISVKSCTSPDFSPKKSLKKLSPLIKSPKNTLRSSISFGSLDSWKERSDSGAIVTQLEPTVKSKPPEYRQTDQGFPKDLLDIIISSQTGRLDNQRCQFPVYSQSCQPCSLPRESSLGALDPIRDPPKATKIKQLQAIMDKGKPIPQVVLPEDGSYWFEGSEPPPQSPRIAPGVPQDTPDYQIHDDDNPFMYRRHFMGKDHYNLMSSSPTHPGPMVLSIIRDVSGPHPVTRALLRLRTGAKVINTTDPDLESPRDIIRSELGSSPPPLSAIATPGASSLIAAYDERSAVSQFKFGILYQKKGQYHEEELFSNTEISEEFQQFLTLLGDRIVLKDHMGYRGGLDTRHGQTGTDSLYRRWGDREIMFHVSPWLPYTQGDPQQLQRKRHIGNDIVAIVFQEEDAIFSPDMIASSFLHAYILIQPLSRRDGHEISYRVCVTGRKEVPFFGPSLPPKCEIWRHGQDLANFLGAKLINAELAALKGGRFAALEDRTRSSLFDALIEKLRVETIEFLGQSKDKENKDKNKESKENNKEDKTNRFTDIVKKVLDRTKQTTSVNSTNNSTLIQNSSFFSSTSTYNSNNSDIPTVTATSDSCGLDNHFLNGKEERFSKTSDAYQDKYGLVVDEKCKGSPDSLTRTPNHDYERTFVHGLHEEYENSTNRFVPSNLELPQFNQTNSSYSFAPDFGSNFGSCDTGDTVSSGAGSTPGTSISGTSLTYEPNLPTGSDFSGTSLTNESNSGINSHIESSLPRTYAYGTNGLQFNNVPGTNVPNNYGTTLPYSTNSNYEATPFSITPSYGSKLQYTSSLNANLQYGTNTANSTQDETEKTRLSPPPSYADSDRLESLKREINRLKCEKYDLIRKNTSFQRDVRRLKEKDIKLQSDLSLSAAEIDRLRIILSEIDHS